MTSGIFPVLLHHLGWDRPHNKLRAPLIIPNLSLPRRRESSNFDWFWIPRIKYGAGSACETVSYLEKMSFRTLRSVILKERSDWRIWLRTGSVRDPMRSIVPNLVRDLSCTGRSFASLRMTCFCKSDFSLRFEMTQKCIATQSLCRNDIFRGTLKS